MFTLHQYDTTYDLNSQASTRTFLFGQHAGRIALQAYKKAARVPRLLIRKHEKVSKINVFKGREHGTKSKNLILTGTKGADVKISALFLSPRHRQPSYGVFPYPYLYPPEKCIN